MSMHIFADKTKVRSKLLYRGRIRFDATDYAVVRVDAEAAENPSFWIKKGRNPPFLCRERQVVAPETNRSESKIRLRGSAVLTIDYGIYR